MSISQKSWSLSELAKYLEGEVQGDPNIVIDSLATLSNAQKNQLSFYHNSRYLKDLKTTNAGAILINRNEDLSSLNKNFIRVASAHLAFARLTQLINNTRPYSTGIHPSAIIETNVMVDPSCYIGPHVVIETGSHLGAKVFIGANTVIGENVLIGAHSIIYSNVTIYKNVKIGEQCIIHSGAVIGSDGFGFAYEPEGWVKIHHFGGVKIEDQVEIGANTTIDAGVLEPTLINKGVKLDNQIQVGHNVIIGEDTVIAGCTAIAGSARIGKGCMIGGGVCIAGHLEIADKIIVLGMTGVTKSLKNSKKVYSSGVTVKERHELKESISKMRKVDVIAQSLKILEEKITKIEGH